MGLVPITSWYPNFKGSQFGLPPSEIHRMTGLPPKIVWTMTYSHRPHQCDSWIPFLCVGILLFVAMGHWPVDLLVNCSLSSNWLTYSAFEWQIYLKRLQPLVWNCRGRLKHRLSLSLSLSLSLPVYVYMYVCLCASACVRADLFKFAPQNDHAANHSLESPVSESATISLNVPCFQRNASLCCPLPPQVQQQACIRCLATPAWTIVCVRPRRLGGCFQHVCLWLRRRISFHEEQHWIMQRQFSGNWWEGKVPAPPSQNATCWNYWIKWIITFIHSQDMSFFVSRHALRLTAGSAFGCPFLENELAGPRALFTTDSSVLHVLVCEQCSICSRLVKPKKPTNVPLLELHNQDWLPLKDSIASQTHFVMLLGFEWRPPGLI